MNIAAPRPIRATAALDGSYGVHDIDAAASGPSSSPSIQRSRKRVAFSDQCLLIPRTYRPFTGATQDDVPAAVDESPLFRHLVKTSTQRSAPTGQEYQGRISALLSGHSKAKASWSDTDLSSISLDDERTSYTPTACSRTPKSSMPSDDYFSSGDGRGSSGGHQALYTAHLIRRAESPRLVTRKGVLKRPNSASQQLSIAAIRSGVYAGQQQSHQPAAIASPTFASPTSPLAANHSGPLLPSPPSASVAAPRASYRPLRLGSADSDDEEEGDVAQSASNRGQPIPHRFTSPQPQPRLPPTTSLRVVTTTLGSYGDGPGPPLVQVDKASILLGPPRADSRAKGPRAFYQTRPAAESCPNILVHYIESDSTLAASSEQGSHSRGISSSSRDSSSSATSDTTPSELKGGKSGSTSGWFKRRRKRSSDQAYSTPAPAQSAHGMTASPSHDFVIVAAEEEEDADGPPEPVRLVPLHAECACLQCSGRISAGQSTHYVPHWSRGARAKWLADRKQAELSASAGGNNGAIVADRLRHKIQSTDGNSVEELRNTRFNARSPPPPLSSSFSMPSPSAELPTNGLSHLLAGTSTPLQSPTTEKTTAILEAATREGADPPASSSTITSVDDEGQAGEDLLRILSQSHHHPHAGGARLQPPAVQVDEMDQMQGETRYPSAMGHVTNEQLVAATRELQIRPSSTPVGVHNASLATSGSLQVPMRWGSPAIARATDSPRMPTPPQQSSSSPVPWRSPSPLSSPALQHVTNGMFANGVSHTPPPTSIPERRPTPVGVSEEETIPDLDASLSAHVDSVLAARQERQRLQKAKRRGGARGMMAQLEEAEAQAEAANRQQRLMQSPDMQHSHTQPLPQMQSQVSTQQPLSRRHSTLGHSDTSRHSRPPLRTSSPVVEPPSGGSGTVRPSSPFMEKIKGAFRRSSSHSHKYEVPSQPLQASFGHGRSLSYGGGGGGDAGNRPAPSAVAYPSTRPPPVRTPMRSRSDGGSG